MHVLLRCPGNNCRAAIRVTCLDHDQEVTCSACSGRFVFFNIGKAKCGRCGKDLTFALNTAQPSCYCDGCRREISHELGNIFEPFRLEHEQGYQYCGLASITGHEQQVRNAERAFRRIEAKDPGSRAKKIVYLEMIKDTDTSFPLKYARFIHVTCNFKLNPNHNNAKYMALLFSIPLAKLLEDLCARRGVVGIWFSVHEARKLLEEMPILAPFKTRFRDIPLPILTEILQRTRTIWTG